MFRCKAWARKTEDLTSDKTDDKDAVRIARLTAQLRCYLPEPVDETWACLRVVRNMFNALSDIAGVLSHRLGALERVGWVLTDWDAAHANHRSSSMDRGRRHRRPPPRHHRRMGRRTPPYVLGVLVVTEQD